MKNIENGYVINSDGTVTYDCNYHTARFTFLKPQPVLSRTGEKEISTRKSVKSRFTEFMMAIIGEDPNEFNQEDFIKEYLKLGVGDIPHFVHQYVWTRYKLSGILEAKESEELYLKGVDLLNDLADQGKIPRSNSPS